MRSAAGISFLLLAATTLPGQNQEVSTAMPGKVVAIGPYTVDVGPIRVIAREARSPQISTFSDGTIVLTGGNPLVSTNIRSGDRGRFWEPQQQYMGFLNTLELGDGSLLVLDYDLQVVNAGTGVYQLNRWSSPNKGVTLNGPQSNARVTLPPGQFDPTFPHWLHDFVEMDNGDLIAVVNSLSPGAATLNSPWDVALIESTDGGLNWSFKSMVASQATISDPGGALTKHNWPLYYASEPVLLHTGGDNLVCVSRTANDETTQTSEKIAPATSRYHDLASTVRGDGIYSGVLNLSPNSYYQPGPPNAPLIITHSSDRGATWSPATPMKHARGVFPRMAQDANGLVALVYGGLSGVPRWGHAIQFSDDDGVTWSKPVRFGHFLTTGYAPVVAVGPGHFVCFFDVTPPQPWTNHERWWIGAVDIRVTTSPVVSAPQTHRTTR